MPLLRRSQPRKCSAFPRPRHSYNATAFVQCRGIRTMPRHKTTKNSPYRASTEGCFLLYVLRSTQSKREDYSMIVATLPEPTVLPPSLIANVRPCSIAIGWMSSIVISMLSPGMHISVPAGRLQTPVTSVVLK